MDFCILKFVKLLIIPKLSLANLSLTVDRDRRPSVPRLMILWPPQDLFTCGPLSCPFYGRPYTHALALAILSVAMSGLLC